LGRDCINGLKLLPIVNYCNLGNTYGLLIKGTTIDVQ